ncbi:hypothetical protein [Halobacillus naozhouensis]|uniref:YrzI family small protein n=1 Tax=Halobacillus naozhouensis TaxID=554880 RepID=A0ABY8J6F8_9BACI|nr:hypothetical protein [Halobacillus naozhouensis]WFT76541.1 hypothetical protein P9989_09330 [Halobacillus naozhouensis]
MRINMIIFTISIEKRVADWRDDVERNKCQRIHRKIEENKRKHLYI